MIVSPFRYAVPALSWVLFFVFSILIMADVIEITFFKGVLMILFFITGVFSSIYLVGSGFKKSSK